MKTLIIAEAGVNHNGDMELARGLIEAAAAAGADIVKFQSFRTEAMVSKTASKADYQKNKSDSDHTQYQMLRQLELNRDQHLQLMAHCRHCGIQFLSTAFDLESIDLLRSLSIPLYKIPSGEITNKPYLKAIASQKKPVIMSTGMSELSEIEAALAVLCENGLSKEDITLLHCNTQYPTPMNEVNLRAMVKMGETLGMAVGYSDHTRGIEVPIAAVALGACVIEKHFTLDRGLPGPDHQASLEPQELKAMVSAIRNIEQALSGSGIKEAGAGELQNRVAARKSIVAARAIRRGEVLTEQNLGVKRPGNGLSPMRWDEVLGQRAVRDFEQDELIEL
ncbi:MAG: N-acetylneuraminate synthase [Bacteroidales bacterium]|nr:N-acetylneuraminate synthase [Bacteroidales bacterium]